MLSALYLAGIIFACLKQDNNFLNHPSRFLGKDVILLQVVFINILGFIPNGYLMMATLSNNKSKKTAAIIAMITGIGTSFMIEMAQYC